MRLFAPKRVLKMEMFFVFGMLPAIISIIRPQGWIIPILWIIGALSWRVLQSHGYYWRKEWNAAAVSRENVHAIVRRFVPNAIAMTIFTWCFIPGPMLSLPLQHPVAWVLIMVFYPLLSVVPQEVIYRSFFLKRYNPIIPPEYMQLANAAIFGWVHIIMHNWIAIFFSAIGGWLFTDTYRRTRSLALVSLEHSLYGCFIFTIGLGSYFFHGHMH